MSRCISLRTVIARVSSPGPRLTYRAHSLGTSLTDALDELIRDERIDPQLAMKVLTQFDRIMAETLQEKVKARLTFKVITPPWTPQVEGRRGHIFLASGIFALLGR